MKCEDARQWIEDYHDGELDGPLEPEVGSHIKGCPECSRELELLRAEDGLYQTYAAGIERQMSAESALWSRTSAGLKSPAVRRVPWLEAIRSAMSPLRLAYALLLVVISVAGTLFTVEFFKEKAAERVAQSGGGRDLESALRSIANAEKEYQEAIRLLSNIVDRRKPTLDPQLVAELDRNLQEIDANIAATRKAFRAHPSDPEFALFMLAAYAKKVELLQELAS